MEKGLAIRSYQQIAGEPGGAVRRLPSEQAAASRGALQLQYLRRRSRARLSLLVPRSSSVLDPYESWK